MSQSVKQSKPVAPLPRAYSGLGDGISELLEIARRASARTVNAFMTATYWEVGRRIVEFEQAGEKRAGYGDSLLARLADDLTAQFGRGFSRFNLGRFRQFYIATPVDQIRATLSLKSPATEKRATVSNELDPLENGQTLSGKLGGPEIRSAPPNNSETASRKSTTGPAPFALSELARAFPLPWSDYVLLIGRSRSPEAFAFYQAEALRGGWSVRQLQRQMDSQFYERTALSRNKAAMLAKGALPQPGDAVSAEEEIRHPLVLEFLGLCDEYSETDLEDGLIRNLETFLLELGNAHQLLAKDALLILDELSLKRVA